VHGIDNLWIAGSSLFPTSGWANPTLTLVALVVRLARRLAHRRSPAATISTTTVPEDPHHAET